MALRLSHSSVNKYLSCPKAYKYHYIDRWREKTTTSALLFGSAIDTAINAMLAKHEYKDAFDKAWMRGKINGREEDLPECTLLGYRAADFDFELLHTEDLFAIGHAKARYDDLEKRRSILNEDERKLFNLFNWHCMRRKGHLMLEAYARDILPHITRVIGTQIKVAASNGEDEIIGYIDAVVEWEDGRIFPIDNKTSSLRYPEHSISTSQQLGLYAELTGYDTAAYFVMLKQIKKNRVKQCSVCGFDGSGGRHKTCHNIVGSAMSAMEGSAGRCNGEWIETIRPEAETQIVIGQITSELKNNVVETFDDVAKAVKAQIFPRNMNSCHAPWGRCAFFGLCHGGDTSQIERME